MKFILTLLFSLFIVTIIYGQTITYDDFRSVIPFLQKEDFKDAFEITNQLLGSTQNDSSDLRGIVTYMNIFSSAGMVSQKQMSYDDFSKNANKYVGRYIVMPIHPCIDSSKNGFNSLQFITQDGQLQGMTVASNNKGISILCFEYFKYADTIKPGDYIGKTVRCGGILESFSAKPPESGFNIACLYWPSRLVLVGTSKFD